MKLFLLLASYKKQFLWSRKINEYSGLKGMYSKKISILSDQHAKITKIHKFEIKVGEVFFDFRGMIMALLAFDNQEYCTLIDIFLRKREGRKSGENHNISGLE
jgi:hypothetical protein